MRVSSLSWRAQNVPSQRIISSKMTIHKFSFLKLAIFFKTYYFQVSYFAPKRHNTNYCNNEFTAGCAHLIAYETLREYVLGNSNPDIICKRPCIHQEFKISKFELKLWPSRVANTSRLNVYLASTEVTIKGMHNRLALIK